MKNEIENNNEENEDNQINNEDVDNSNNKIDTHLMKYIEKTIDICRPISYAARGFGFLISNTLINDKQCATVVVVEASK